MLNIFNLKKGPNKLIVDKNKGDFISPTRHYPPADREWINSVYTFNKNTTKLLPSADKSVYRLVTSYFNMFSRFLEKSVRARRLRTWMRRVSVQRIITSKPHFKHTNDKVIITVYLYNRQKSYYLKKIKRLNILSSFSISWFKKRLQFIKTKSNKLLSLIRVEKLNMFNIFNVKPKLHTKLLTKASLFNSDMVFMAVDKSNYINLIKRYLHKQKVLLRYMQLMMINKSKFKSIYLTHLSDLISKIYNKKVIFNLVVLKYYYLNSDIYTHILALKTRNRKNRLLRVIYASFNSIKLPYARRLFYLSDTDKPKIISVQNLLLNNMNYNNEKSDKLNSILNTYYQLNSTKESYNIPNKSNTVNNINMKQLTLLKKSNINNYVLNNIKHKTITGVRIEAAGRLSKRIIASRAVFKIKFKGGIRNIDSSYKGLTTVTLKGNLRSNVQFSKAFNKTRIGAFGLKGWIGSI